MPASLIRRGALGPSAAVAGDPVELPGLPLPPPYPVGPRVTPQFAAPADQRLVRRGQRVAIPTNRAAKLPESKQLIVPENLPKFLTISFGFFGTAGQGVGLAGISVPTGTVATNTAAWFPLLDLDPLSRLGQQAGLFAVAGSLLPTGYNATVNDQVWGSVQGCKAGIVVGTNLPIAAGAWTIAPCSLPGIMGEGAQDATGAQYFWWTTFPPGSYADAIPLKAFAFESLAPYLADIPLGKRLQAALVVGGLSNTSGGVKNLCGAASLRMMVGQTQPVGDFAKR